MLLLMFVHKVRSHLVVRTQAAVGDRYAKPGIPALAAKA